MGKYTDLEYLESMSGGESEIIIEMIELFKMQVPEFIEEADNSLSNKDWNKLGALAHKAKSSLAIMGMNEAVEDLDFLEINAKDETNIEKFPYIVERFKFYCLQAIEELDEEIDNF
ncbi:MAG: hypothetical protein B6I24_04120 [Bacteroidetes bacterium 4572_128]|nr:MAG: hypothetical protein B6I24_04120 [Bacteroidetes bacterium 4572_128]